MRQMSKFHAGRWVEFTDRSNRPVRYFEITKSYNTRGPATRRAKVLNQDRSLISNKCSDFFVLDNVDYMEGYESYNPICNTYNMLGESARYVEIRAHLFGGCCDVGTELYHSM
jgi:hypothetical protein